VNILDALYSLCMEPEECLELTAQRTDLVETYSQISCQLINLILYGAY
jgi:hypothetical protein